MLTDIFTNKHLYLLFLLSSTVTIPAIIPAHNKEVSPFNFKKAALVVGTTAVVCAGVTIIYRKCYPSKPAPKIQSLRGPGSSASTLNKTATPTIIRIEKPETDKKFRRYVNNIGPMTMAIALIC